MAPPPSGPAVGRTSGGGWDWRWLLFSFKGRAHRAHYWAVTGALIGLGLVVIVPLLAMAGDSIEDPDFASDEVSGVAVLAMLAVYLLILWVSLALGVKQWHDRDKSGAWMFLALVPFGSLWILVECGFLPGTDGPNQYGGDPRRVSTSP
jgi:uncharacterized membrane protein YhaH (DUF805 family)